MVSIRLNRGSIGMQTQEYAARAANAAGRHEGIDGAGGATAASFNSGHPLVFDRV